MSVARSSAAENGLAAARATLPAAEIIEGAAIPSQTGSMTRPPFAREAERKERTAAIIDASSVGRLGNRGQLCGVAAVLARAQVETRGQMATSGPLSDCPL